MKRKNTFNLIVNVITLMIISVGATFAYFSATTKGTENGVTASATTFKVSLGVVGEYIGFPIIPLDDDDIITAYNNECKDSIDNGACNSYTITISNSGNMQSIEGSLDFSLSGLNNLSYLVLDSEGEVYQEKTSITTSGEYSIGDGFDVSKDETKTFTLVIWLTNLDTVQNDADSGGTYSANVIINSANGDKLSGSLTGSF